MRADKRQLGVTLPEMVVVIAIVAVMVSLSIPSVRGLYNSMGDTSGSTAGMISSALASAKAIAIKHQRYAGVRFQKVYRDNEGYPKETDLLNQTDVLKADQYMTFIIYDEKTGVPNDGFLAVEGINPIKLPSSIMVLSLVFRHKNTGIGASDATIGPMDPLLTTNAANLANNAEAKYLRDISSFSLIFSPSGKLVIHNVRVRNKDGDFQPVNLNNSRDDIFNSPDNIKYNKTGMFIQDDYAGLGLGAEPSQREFVICEKTRFEKLDANQRYGYLCNELPRIYINRYTGTIVNK